MSRHFEDSHSHESRLIITQDESKCISQLKQWIETQTATDFYGRTDDRFLIMFVRGCKHDMDRAKKKVKSYYDNRRRIPNWWANRDLRDDNMQSLLKLMITMADTNKPQQPSIAITRMSRLPRHHVNFDDIIKLHTILVDMVLQRPHCQLNGFVWVLDWKDVPYWLLVYVLSPFVLKNIIQSFFLSTPLKLKGIHMVNSPLVAYTVWKLAKPFFTQKLKDRVKLYRSDYKAIFDHIPIELMPEEYGGNGPTLKQCEDAFLKEVLSLTDYIADNNKYGFYQ